MKKIKYKVYWKDLNHIIFENSLPNIVNEMAKADNDIVLIEKITTEIIFEKEVKK